MPNLRRVSATTWAVVAIILLALIPESIPLGPIRAIARYLLVAYLPGLAVWNRLRSSSSSLVDAALYPSLLSILPFAWLGLAGVALGFDLRIAGWMAIAFFLAIGFCLGWSGHCVRPCSSERVALAIAAVLAVLLLVIPFAANSFQAIAWDAPLHAAIVSRILAGIIPPDSPMMAGEPANYYWLYHFYSALLLRLTGWSIYQVFAVLNVHAFVLFVFAGYRIASRLTTSLFGRISAAWMLIFGLNAFGWAIFLSHGAGNPDKWYSLVVPFAMVHGYSVSLGSLIHEFLDGFPFVISFAFSMAWLDALLARAEGERGRSLAIGAVILATAFYLHPLSAVFLAATSLGAVVIFVVIDHRTPIAERKLLIFDLLGSAFAAVIVAAPYAWNILHAKAGAPLSLELNFAFAKGQAWSMVATVGLIGIFAAPALWSVFGEQRRPVLLLGLVGVATITAALVTHVTFEAEYKLIYLLAFALAPLIAAAWNFWRRGWLTRAIFGLGLIVCVPTNAITSYCFTSRPPRDERPVTRTHLLQWIREKTPTNAILVERPWWKQYQTSDAAFLYLDRYWFDISIYANRRQLVGYETPMLEQWGYRDIALRQELARRLTEGQTLSSLDVSYLSDLAAPIIVVTDSAAAGELGAFDSATYTRIYEDGEIRAYRVELKANPGL